jgi:hypothetical protein
MNTKKYRSSKIKALSKAWQAKQKRIWDTRLLDLRSMVPVKKKAKLSITEARKANMQFGGRAAGYVRMDIRRLTKDLDIRRRLGSPESIVAVGYGFGYDSKWVRQATEAGFQTWWIDVSSVPWMWMTKNLQEQFAAIPQPASGSYPEPQVRTYEIQSLLADPGKVGLDVSKVGIWYLCRLLNCLSTRSAKAVLQEIGRTALGSRSDPNKRKAVIVINALCDDNLTDTCGGTSIVRSKKMVLANISRGAGRPVEARYVRHFPYFDKQVTAMTIMAKK